MFRRPIRWSRSRARSSRSKAATKGSRVSVVEGEVKVNHAGKDETLHPGDQTTTKAGLDKTPVQRTVAWSRNAAKYANLVTELRNCERRSIRRVVRPGVRYSSTVCRSRAREHRVLRGFAESERNARRVTTRSCRSGSTRNPALAEVVERQTRRRRHRPQQTLARVQEFGSHLGDEIVVSAGWMRRSEPSGVLVLGEVKDGASFRTYLDEQLARFARESAEARTFAL